MGERNDYLGFIEKRISYYDVMHKLSLGRSFMVVILSVRVSDKLADKYLFSLCYNVGTVSPGPESCSAPAPHREVWNLRCELVAGDCEW